MKKYIFLFSMGFLFLLIYTSSLTTLESLGIAVTVFYFLEFLNDLGERIVLMDISVLALFITCVMMPVVFYHVYTKEYHMARLWVKYMPISSDDYFSFAIPGVLAMSLGLRIRLKKLRFRNTPEVYLANAKQALKSKPAIGISLIAIGLISGFLEFLSPDSTKQIFYLADHLTYVGVFYVIYSPYQYKKYIVPGVILLMLGQSIAIGMFGEMIYILACSVTLMLLGTKVKFRAKLGFAVVGIFMILILQSIKMEYRKVNWVEGKGADPVYFAALIGNKLSDVSTLLDADNMFWTSVRMNQGWLVAVTMKRVPARHPFGYGESMLESVEAAFIPRFLWPEKPNAGGKANLKKFWGYVIVGYSMNIGTLGEAYANFDVLGGIFYMFIYGLFFNFFLSSILKLCEKRPTVILWLPYLFFYSISVETDLYTTMGALIKSMIFTFIIFKIYDLAFHIKL
jgi:hypothetical protein